MDTYDNIYDVLHHQIPIKTFTMMAKVQSDISLAPYAGSMLRGIFGHGLYKLRINDTIAESLSDIDKYKLCPYRMIFEPPQLKNPVYGITDIPVPYVIVPPLDGKRLYQQGACFTFHITLIGNAIQKLPYVVHAFDIALQHGVGRKNPQGHLGNAILQSVSCDNHIIWDDQQKTILPYTPYLSVKSIQTAQSNIHLILETPLRLQQEGVLITHPDLITAERLLMSAVRRVCTLMTIHTDTDIHMDFARLRNLAHTINIQQDIKFHNWTRYSSRQQQKMDLGGWVGHITLTGDITPFLPYLQLAQYTHIGKNTPFGLGKIRIQDTDT